jgi:hypothetical protein
MGFEISWYSSDRVCFAEHAGDSLPRGEDFDGRFCRCGRLAGHTASVWRRLRLRAVLRREEEQHTAAVMAAILGVKLSGFDTVAAGLRLRDLQLLLVQVVHFVLIWGFDLFVGSGFMYGWWLGW